MESRVNYIEKRSDLGALENAKRFHKVFQQFAEIYNVDVEVDTPGGKKTVVQEGKGKVFVHIFGFPDSGRSEDVSKSLISNLWGFFPPAQSGTQMDDDGYIFAIGEGVRTVLADSHFANYGHDEQKSIYCDFKKPIARVIRNNLFILFNLIYIKWPGDSLILRLILSHASSIMCGERAYKEVIARQLLLLGDECSGILNEPVDLEAVIEPFAKARIAHWLSDAQAKAGTFRDEKLAYSQELTALGVELLEKEARLGNAKDSMDKNEVGKEFDEILAGEYVKGMRVEGDVLTVYTTPITMELSDGRKFLIGEYAIKIRPTDTATNCKEWIKVAEYGWRGPYRHNEISSNKESPCWGGLLHPDITKGLAEYNFQIAIQDAFMFLIAEQSGGVDNPLRKNLKEVPPAPEPFYTSERDKMAERDNYVVLVEKFRSKMLENRLRERIKSIREIMPVSQEALIKAIAGIAEEESRETLFTKCLENFPLDNEVHAISVGMRLIDVEGGKDWVLAIFGPIEANNPLGRVLHESMAVYIDSEGSARAYMVDSGKEFKLTISENMKMILRELVAYGFVGSALRALREYVLGTFTNTYPSFESEKLRLKRFLEECADKSSATSKNV